MKLSTEGLKRSRTRHVGPPIEAKPLDIWRWLDPTNMNVSFWGESFDLSAVTTEIELISTALEREFAKDNWDAIAENDARCRERA